jgi:hypothetical protein
MGTCELIWNNPMSKKKKKTLIKQCNVCFYVVKGLVNEFNFLENDMFCQIFNIKINKIILRIFFN